MPSPSMNDSALLFVQSTNNNFGFPSQFPAKCKVPECETTLKSFEDLASHEMQHADTPKGICFICHCSFSSAQALRIHLNTRYVKAGIHACGCGATYADPSRKSRCTKSHTTVFRCPQPRCGYENPRKELVLRHLKQAKEGKGKGGLPHYAFSEPIAKSQSRPGPPKHQPGREPAPLIRYTEDVRKQLEEMERMCKEYKWRRLATLSSHLIHFGWSNLAVAVDRKVSIISADRRRTSPQRSSSGDSWTPAGSDQAASDSPAEQHHSGTQGYSPAPDENSPGMITFSPNPFGDNGISLRNVTTQISQTPAAEELLTQISHTPEELYDQTIRHEFSPRQLFSSLELVPMLHQVQLNTGGSHLDAGQVTSALGANDSLDIYGDVAANVYPYGDTGVTDHYGLPGGNGYVVGMESDVIMTQGVQNPPYHPTSWDDIRHFYGA